MIENRINVAKMHILVLQVQRFCACTCTLSCGWFEIGMMYKP